MSGLDLFCYVFQFLFCLIWSCSCPCLVGLLVDSPHLSVPRYRVHKPQSVQFVFVRSTCFYVCFSSSCCGFPSVSLIKDC